MFEWIIGTLEYQNWGFNSLTIGSLGTLAFTIVEGWGLTKQNGTIWKTKSGESVSINLFSFLLFFLFAFFIYGLYIKSIAVIINGLVLGILHVPILFGLWRFKGFSRMEKVCFAISFAMIPAMIFVPWKDAVYIVIVSGAVFAIATQPWEIWERKSSGVVDIHLLVAYSLSTTFWVVYAFSTKQVPLEISTSITSIIIIVTLALWFKYRKADLTKF